MGYGLMKAHHAIQKDHALRDYQTVKAAFEQIGKPAIEPKGKHWHKIEDATAEMLKQLPEGTVTTLIRGVNYYQGL